MSAHFATSRPSVQVPALTGEQMREVDRIMMEELHIQLAQMMENAGRNLADLALRRFHPETVTVLAGTGGNGWGGLVAARHLSNRGARVQVTLASEPVQVAPVTGHQLDILTRISCIAPPGDGSTKPATKGSSNGR